MANTCGRIASYTDGKGKHTSMATTVAMVVVRTDHAPEFPKTEDGKRDIPENSLARAEVGAPVTAMDEDMGQVLTYSLSGADAGSFTIMQDDSATDGNEGGQISVKSGIKLDRETKSTYMVAVMATDPDNLSASIDVTITVMDEDEAPEIVLGGLVLSGRSSLNLRRKRHRCGGNVYALRPGRRWC